MTDNLQIALEAYNLNVLITMANFQGVKAQGMKKGPLTHVLSHRFSDPSSISKAYGGLGSAAREVIAILMRDGGEVRLPTILHRLLVQKLVDPQARRTSYGSTLPNYRDGNSRNLEELMAHLAACGLVFAHKLKNYYGQENMLELNLADVYFIPAEVLSLLPHPPPEPEWTPAPAPGPVQTLEGSARAFQRDLYLYWSYLAHNQVDLTARGLITKKHLTALNATLAIRETIQTGQTESDFLRLVFIRALLDHMGLIQTVGDTLLAQMKPEFFGAAPQERIKTCLEAYITMRQVNELAWAHHIQIQGAAPLLPTPNIILDARRLVAMHLKPASSWLKIGNIVARVRERYYEFLFPRITANPYYYEGTNPYYASGNAMGWSFTDVSGGEGGWDEVEGGLIRTMIVGPLYWLGLVDVGFSTPKGKSPDLFRLTTPGAWLLANAAAPEIPQGGGQVVVQPDFTLTAFDPVSDLVLYQLDQFAQRQSSERAIIYRLTDKSVYAGQKRGWDSQHIKTCLEELTHQALPGNVARTLDEWQTRHERIRIYPSISLLHAASPEDMRALEKIDALAPWLGQRKTETVALLPAQSKTEDFLELLIEHNWLPLFARRGGTVPSGFLAIDGDGRLSFTIKNPDLYLRGYLARFADPDGDGAYRLTPQSLRRAANSGMDAPTVAAELERVLDGPIPEKLRQRMLAWAGHYGTASLKQTPVLVFQDKKGLEDLLRDPEISSLLHPLKPADITRMVTLREKDLERVKLLLAERGVDLIS